MFQRFKTKCSNLQNETYLCESFSPPPNAIKKHREKNTSSVLFYSPIFWLSRKKITNFTTNKEVIMPCCNTVLMPLSRHYITRQNLCAAYHVAYTASYPCTRRYNSYAH